MENIKLTRKIATYKRANGQYLFEKSDMTDELIPGKNIIMPLVCDTEFWQAALKSHLDGQIKHVSPKGKEYSLNLSGSWQHGRYGVTSQIKGIWEDEGVILCHPDLVEVGQQFNQPLRHPLAVTGFDPIDYLREIGLNVRLNRGDTVSRKLLKSKKTPTCEFVLYSHFALAELFMLCNGEYRDDVQKIALNKDLKKPQVQMQRRLRMVTPSNHGQSDSVELSWRLNIEGERYRIKVTIIDTCALHGVNSYKDLCESANIKLEAKESMDGYKTMMHIGYFENPVDFDAYSLGDLMVYEVLYNNSHNFKKIWNSLEIGEYFQPPRLTIGATIRDIFVAKVCKEFGLNPDNDNNELISLLNFEDGDKVDFKTSKNKLLETVCKHGTAEYLKQFITSTKCLNAKVEGGRCRNNRPNLVKLVSKVLLDIDYSGCYGEGQRNQLYPFGRPIYDEYDYPSNINQYITLKEWLKLRKHGTSKCELVPGLWQARVSCKQNNDGSYDDLKFAQDYLASWFDFKITDIKNMKTDSETVDAAEVEQLEVRTGLTKIFNYQCVNSIITHDFIDWLFNVASPQQKNDLLDNLFVLTAMYYPAYERVNSPIELLEKIKNHDGKNTSKSKQRRKGSRHIKITEECTAWYAVNLGEFIIDDLLAWRKIYPKKNGDGSKNPMNALYKLCVNTLYGDMVSPFFNISNVVVGNNVTARARAACYYAEKGFYGVQSITDGVAFDLNAVVYPRGDRRITSQSIINLHRENDVTKKNIVLKPLDNADKIKLNWIETGDRDDKDKQIILPEIEIYKNGVCETITPKRFVEIKDNKEEIIWVNNAQKWVDKVGMIHLQSLFNVDVLQAKTTSLKVTLGEDGSPIKTFVPCIGQFEFESKSYYDEGKFHGSANYHLKGKGGENMAMRSYEKKSEHDSVYLNEDENIALTPYLKGMTPAEFFMSQLDNPGYVQRSKVFIKQGILKLNDAKAHNERWSAVGRMAGDTIQKSGLLREFSLSQFTFKNIEQFKNISREVEGNKRRFNQSYEGYFIRENGLLDFQSMITEIDKLLGDGVESLNKIFDKSRHRNRNDNMNHPESEVLEKVRESLLRPVAGEEVRDYFDTDIVSDDEGVMYRTDYDSSYDDSFLLPEVKISDEEMAELLEDVEFTL